MAINIIFSITDSERGKEKKMMRAIERIATEELEGALEERACSRERERAAEQAMPV